MDKKVYIVTREFFGFTNSPIKKMPVVVYADRDSAASFVVGVCTDFSNSLDNNYVFVETHATAEDGEEFDIYKLVPEKRKGVEVEYKINEVPFRE